MEKIDVFIRKMLRIILQFRDLVSKGTYQAPVAPVLTRLLVIEGQEKRLFLSELLRTTFHAEVHRKS